MKWHRPDTLRRLAMRGLTANARLKGPTWAEWDISGKCERPVPIDLYARHERDRGFTPGYTMEMHVRCRQCVGCLKYRAYIWRRRATDETGWASRTWFSTFTASPVEHHHALSRARHKIALQGLDFDALGEQDRFSTLVSAYGDEITRYLKRVRRQSNAKLRYLWVTESHKSGWPHFHALIHEVSSERPCRHKILQDEWKLGFSSHKLVSGHQEASYVTKYLAKSSLARVRASIDYGNPRPLDIASLKRGNGDP